MSKRKQKTDRIKELESRLKKISPVYVNGKSYDSLTPFMDKLDETNRLFLPSEKDIRELERTPCSPLDSYFLGVADKHGLDLSDDGDYDD